VSVATNDGNVAGKLGTEVTAIKITLGGQNDDSGSTIRQKIQSREGRTMGVTRRDLFIGAGGLATSLALGPFVTNAVGAVSTASEAPTVSKIDRKMRVIVAGGHPGDPEYGCGGTVARLTNLGHEVVLLYLNDGGWPPTSAAIRIAEAKKACELLKARPAYAGQVNGNAVVDNAHYEAYAKIIDAEKPDMMFTQWPIDNHRDHRAIAMLTYDAWRQSKKNFSLYYYEVSDGEDTLQFSPTHYVDITETEPVKRSACYAHASQTPDRYYALQDQVAAFRGIEGGSKRAEAFVLQVQSPGDPLQAIGLS
jgi:N-acetylglucosamine malate deacetylase 1